jgi:uncharacterized protein YajQ (UPF0234 family)
MPSFDVLSKVDPQIVENAINVAKKEILTRYDLQGTNTDVEFNKKDLTLVVSTSDEMKLNAVVDILITRGAKQGIDPRAFDISEDHYKSGALIKKNIKLRNGLDKEAMKKITKAIKDSGIKVQPAQMDDIVRVTAKNIDDLQETMAILRKQDFGYPLQFENMKR